MGESWEFVALFGWTAQHWSGLGWRQSVPRRYWWRMANGAVSEWNARRSRPRLTGAMHYT
jgi:hypothetical protein